MSQRVNIGNNFYLFHGNDGPSEFLMITAHGATAGGNFATPDWTTLHFYAPRGHFLIMDMSKFNLSSIVEERIGGGNLSPDYNLTKFQGRHGSADETYATLGAMIDRTRDAIGAGPGAPPQIPANIGPNLRRDLMQQYRNSYENLLPFDILTVRNRSVFRGGSLFGMRLSDAIDAVGAHHQYASIFCSFCRGNLTQGISDAIFEKTGGRFGTDHTHRVQSH